VPAQDGVAFWTTDMQLFPQLPHRMTVLTGNSHPLAGFASQSPKPAEQLP
jgi:hypothetical protein